jgi:FtsP/CotA-like multicopper oxidase with cupredoxin domain
MVFEDSGGKTVDHCHILDHEDRGMMRTVLAQ